MKEIPKILDFWFATKNSRVLRIWQIWRKEVQICGYADMEVKVRICGYGVRICGYGGYADMKRGAESRVWREVLDADMKKRPPTWTETQIADMKKRPPKPTKSETADMKNNLLRGDNPQSRLSPSLLSSRRLATTRLCCESVRCSDPFSRWMDPP